MPIMSDLRTIKTEAAIENAMIELIEIKGFSKIKMVDIANRAQVNRNTIYLHYETKEEIIISILKKAYADRAFLDDLKKVQTQRTGKREIKSLYLSILNKVEHDIELYRVLLTDPNLTGYVNRFLKYFRDEIMKYFENSTANRVKLEYIINGVYGVLSRWVVNAFANKDEIAEQLTELFLNDIRKLKR